MRKRIFIPEPRPAMRLMAIVLISALLLPGSAAWAGLQPPLNKIPVPAPRTNDELAQFTVLSQFIKDVPSAIALGKALFWDMQVGSDGQTACASCHYRAGADPVVGTSPKGTAKRDKNQLNPGPNRTFDIQLLGNTVTAADFPFFQISPPDARVGVDTLTDPITGAPTGTVTRNFDDVTGSQGVLLTQFTGINLGSPVDSGDLISDPTFSVGGNNVRQVTDRNSPSAINAVFNFTSFWDGRGNNIFNGESPFGPLDDNAGVWFQVGGALVKDTKIRIPNASLASQAVGPPLNDVMMSFRGRTFPELGRKMLSLTPLGQQLVDRNDSVFSNVNGQDFTKDTPGLTTSYQALIEDAFQDNLWNSGQSATINTRGVGVQFSQIEANFSLFFGLSVMLYEATLVSDRTPFDRFQLGNQNALNPAAQVGLKTFDNRCASCHMGSELSDAVVGSGNIPNCVTPNCNPVSFTTNDNHRLIQARLTNPLVGLQTAITIDAGFFNLGVRPTADDAGRGGTAPFINVLTSPTASFPLSFTRLAKLQLLSQLTFSTPALPPIIPPTLADAAQGAFRTSGLRNVELTAPYMHNGSMFTLDEVMEFYARGGNFPDVNQPEMAIAPIGNLRGDPVGRLQVVEFMKSLTDDRVRNEWAPFDHPGLTIHNGDEEITLPPTGGIPTVQPGLTMNPIPSPTILASLVTGGTVTDGSTFNDRVTVAVALNNLEPAAATVTGTAWSHTVTGLATLGTNTITVTATDVTGGETIITAPILRLPAAVITGAPVIASNQTGATLTVGGFGVTGYKVSVDGGLFSGPTATTVPIVLSGLSEGPHSVAVLGMGADTFGTPLEQPLTAPTTASWIVKSIPPVLTLSPVAALSGPSLTIGGTVELGIVPRVRASTTASIGPVTVIGGSGIATWSCTVSGLGRGNTDITITALDIAQNVTSQAASVRIILPDGDFRERGATDISDAVKALRIAVGTDVPSIEDKLHGDVAPLVNNVPAPDGIVDVTDALMILKKVVGLVNF